MASQADICNRALSRLGSLRLVAITDDTPQAEACESAWEMVRDEVFRDHPWNSLGARAQLAEMGTTPDFGYDHQYAWPSLCVRVRDVDTEYGWAIEGRKILTDQGAPINVVYTQIVEDTGAWDPLLASAVAARLAMEICEELTQSNTKRELAHGEYQGILARARSADAQEGGPVQFEELSWVTARP